MEDFEAASVAEQLERDVALINHKARITIDVASLVCKGCDETAKQKVCPEYAGCLLDFERRRAAAVRNGSAE